MLLPAQPVRASYRLSLWIPARQFSNETTDILPKSWQKPRHDTKATTDETAGYTTPSEPLSSVASRAVPSSIKNQTQDRVAY